MDELENKEVKTNGNFQIDQIRGFVAKLKLADKETKEYYSALKNRLLSYNGVKDRMTFKQENFRANKGKVAVLKMQGKTLCLFLDINDPATLEKYQRYLKLNEKDKMKDTSHYVRITSQRKLSYALNMIDAMFKEKNIELGQASNVDFTKDIKRESIEAMIAKGLIKDKTGGKSDTSNVVILGGNNSSNEKEEANDVNDNVNEIIEEEVATEEETTEEIVEETSEDSTKEVVEEAVEEATNETPVEDEVVTEETTNETIEETTEVTEVVETPQEEVKEEVKEEEHEDYDKISRKTKIIKGIGTAGIYIFLIFIAAIVLFPFFAMLTSSVKDMAEYQRAVPTIIPEVWHFENYIEAYNAADLGRLFLNTVIVGVISTLLSLVITVLSAFAFARLEFAGKNIMFAALLATMMIPGELFTITNYETVVVWFGWQNTYTVLIVPFLVSVFYIYLLRQNFLQIPNELYLAAKVDGTSDLKYLIKVMVPLSMPTLISITILKMMGAWNSYIWPNLVANDDLHKLVTNGLRGTAFQDDSGLTNFPVQMAAVAIVSFPLFLVFLFLRKYIMRGVSRSGIKG